MFRSGGACEFVDELHARWRERHGDATPRTESTRVATVPQSVFISYAREDVKAAEELRISWTAAGNPVWFDNEALRAGDSFNPQIEQFITRGCSAFIAVVRRLPKNDTKAIFEESGNLGDRSRARHALRTTIHLGLSSTKLWNPKRFLHDSLKRTIPASWRTGDTFFIRDIQNLLSSL